MNRVWIGLIIAVVVLIAGAAVVGIAVDVVRSPTSSLLTEEQPRPQEEKPTTPPNIPAGHDLAAACRACHTTGGVAPWLPSHEKANYSSEICQACHQSPMPEAASTPAPPTPPVPTTATPTPTPTPVASLTGDAAAGKIAYSGKCAACHGATAGPALVGLDPAAIKRAVRQGKGGMPAFGPSVVNDQELEDIVAYIQSLTAGGGGQ